MNPFIIQKNITQNIIVYSINRMIKYVQHEIKIWKLKHMCDKQMRNEFDMHAKCFYKSHFMRQITQRVGIIRPL